MHSIERAFAGSDGPPRVNIPRSSIALLARWPRCARVRGRFPWAGGGGTKNSNGAAGFWSFAGWPARQKVTGGKLMCVYYGGSRAIPKALANYQDQFVFRDFQNTDRGVDAKISQAEGKNAAGRAARGSWAFSPQRRRAGFVLPRPHQMWSRFFRKRLSEDCNADWKDFKLFKRGQVQNGEGCGRREGASWTPTARRLSDRVQDWFEAAVLAHTFRRGRCFSEKTPKDPRFGLFVVLLRFGPIPQTRLRMATSPLFIDTDGRRISGSKVSSATAIRAQTQPGFTAFNRAQRPRMWKREEGERDRRAAWLAVADRPRSTEKRSHRFGRRRPPADCGSYTR